MSDEIAISDLGLGIDKPDEPLILYPNRKAARSEITNLIKIQVLSISLGLIAFLIAMARSSSSVTDFFCEHSASFGAIVGTSIAMLIWLFRKRKLERAVHPLLEMYPDRLVIDSAITLSWSDIKSIESYWGQIVIVPLDEKKLLGNRKSTVRVGGKIRIPHSWLPLDPKDVLQQMNLRIVNLLGGSQVGPAD